MARTKKTDQPKAEVLKEETSMTELKMKDEKGKAIPVHVPDESLDNEGHAESAVTGIHRSC